MVDWQITATTVVCISTGKEVTLIIDRNGKGRCTGYSQNENNKMQTGLCKREACRQIIDYRDKIMAEEEITA
jgi:hypothetical protein